MPENLLTVSETAASTGLKESTIRRWILEKRITYVKLGRRVFIRRVDLDALIDSSLVFAKKKVVRIAEKKSAADVA